MDAHVQKNPAIRGYEPMLETRLDPRTKGGTYSTSETDTLQMLIYSQTDTKEAFTMGDCVREPEQDYQARTGRPPPPHITQAQNIWPAKAPWWREGLYRYYRHIFPLAMKLVKVFALAFDLDDTAFDKYFKFPITGMRALHYPPTPVDEDSPSIGLGAHADFSCTTCPSSTTVPQTCRALADCHNPGLTLVLQDAVPALEVLNQDGVWVDAPPKPGTFVCNVGQYLERQTNGKFPATVHRVRNRTGHERYSLPFFLTMDPDVALTTLDCCVEPNEKPKYEDINVGDLYIRRVLPARQKHPTSIKYRDVPQQEWKYSMLLN